MTPAVTHARQAGIPISLHEYASQGSEAYGEEAARELGLTPEEVFKTLIAKLDDGRLVVAVVPVSAQLDLKRLAAAAGAKRAALADPREAARSTGYVLGGISPLGQKNRLRTFVDRTALGHETIYVSGGRRGLEIRLAPADLVQACRADCTEIAR